jgi:mono/diheme cytochrome c family protein
MRFDLRDCFQHLLATIPVAALFAGLLALNLLAASANNRKLQTDSTPQVKSDRSVYAEIAKAPEKERARRNPLENDADAVIAGSKLFAQHCAECHGNMAEGGKKGPSLRDDEVQRAASGALFWVLTNGVVRRGMPVWSKLPEPQRWQIVSYLKSLRTDISMQPGTAIPKSGWAYPRASGPTAVARYSRHCRSSSL